MPSAQPGQPTAAGQPVPESASSQQQQQRMPGAGPPQAHMPGPMPPRPGMAEHLARMANQGHFPPMSAHQQVRSTMPGAHGGPPQPMQTRPGMMPGARPGLPDQDPGMAGPQIHPAFQGQRLPFAGFPPGHPAANLPQQFRQMLQQRGEAGQLPPGFQRFEHIRQPPPMPHWIAPGAEGNTASARKSPRLSSPGHTTPPGGVSMQSQPRVAAPHLTQGGQPARESVPKTTSPSSAHMSLPATLPQMPPSEQSTSSLSSTAGHTSGAPSQDSSQSSPSSESQNIPSHIIAGQSALSEPKTPQTSDPGSISGSANESVHDSVTKPETSQADESADKEVKECSDGIHCGTPPPSNTCSDEIHCGTPPPTCSDGIHCGTPPPNKNCSDGIHCGTPPPSNTCSDGIHCGTPPPSNTCSDGIHCGTPPPTGNCTDGQNCGTPPAGENTRNEGQANGQNSHSSNESTIQVPPTTSASQSNIMSPQQMAIQVDHPYISPMPSVAAPVATQSSQVADVSTMPRSPTGTVATIQTTETSAFSSTAVHKTSLQQGPQTVTTAQVSQSEAMEVDQPVGNSQLPPAQVSVETEPTARKLETSESAAKQVQQDVSAAQPLQLPVKTEPNDMAAESNKPMASHTVEEKMHVDESSIPKQEIKTETGPESGSQTLNLSQSAVTTSDVVSTPDQPLHSSMAETPTQKTLITDASQTSDVGSSAAAAPDTTTASTSHPASTEPLTAPAPSIGPLTTLPRPKHFGPLPQMQGDSMTRPSMPLPGFPGGPGFPFMQDGLPQTSHGVRQPGQQRMSMATSRPEMSEQRFPSMEAFQRMRGAHPQQQMMAGAQHPQHPMMRPEFMQRMPGQERMQGPGMEQRMPGEMVRPGMEGMMRHPRPPHNQMQMFQEMDPRVSAPMSTQGQDARYMLQDPRYAMPGMTQEQRYYMTDPRQQQMAFRHPMFAQRPGMQRFPGQGQQMPPGGQQYPQQMRPQFNQMQPGGPSPVSSGGQTPPASMPSPGQGMLLPTTLQGQGGDGQTHGSQPSTPGTPVSVSQSPPFPPTTVSPQQSVDGKPPMAMPSPVGRSPPVAQGPSSQPNSNRSTPVSRPPSVQRQSPALSAGSQRSSPGQSQSPGHAGMPHTLPSTEDDLQLPSVSATFAAAGMMRLAEDTSGQPPFPTSKPSTSTQGLSAAQSFSSVSSMVQAVSTVSFPQMATGHSSAPTELPLPPSTSIKLEPGMSVASSQAPSRQPVSSMTMSEPAASATQSSPSQAAISQSIHPPGSAADMNNMLHGMPAGMQGQMGPRMQHPPQGGPHGARPPRVPRSQQQANQQRYPLPGNLPPHLVGMLYNQRQPRQAYPQQERDPSMVPMRFPQGHPMGMPPRGFPGQPGDGSEMQMGPGARHPMMQHPGMRHPGMRPIGPHPNMPQMSPTGHPGGPPQMHHPQHGPQTSGMMGPPGIPHGMPSQTPPELPSPTQRHPGVSPSPGSIPSSPSPTSVSFPHGMMQATSGAVARASTPPGFTSGDFHSRPQQFQQFQRMPGGPHRMPYGPGMPGMDPSRMPMDLGAPRMGLEEHQMMEGMRPRFPPGYQPMTSSMGPHDDLIPHLSVGHSTGVSMHSPHMSGPGMDSMATSQALPSPVTAIKQELPGETLLIFITINLFITSKKNMHVY